MDRLESPKPRGHATEDLKGFKYLKMLTSNCKVSCWTWAFSLCCQARRRARPSFRSVLAARCARSSSWCSWRPWTLEGADHAHHVTP